eukprot:1278810-Ditylum_brightwellii.AAC.1
MTKKETFVLLGKSSPNIPDACVQVIPMPSSNDDDNSDNNSIPDTTPVIQRRRKHCNDASVPTATIVTAQGRTHCPKQLYQPAESGEADGAIQNIEPLEDQILRIDCWDLIHEPKHRKYSIKMYGCNEKWT